MTRDLAAVLWDMDGTLVDTEPYWIEAEHELVAAHGGRWTDDDAKKLVGSELLVSARYIRDVGGVAMEPQAIIEHLLDQVIVRVREHIPWRPGARELLASLVATRIPCALVTMSYQRLAQAIVAGLPADTFATIVAGDDVVNGKPHPEAYLLAAARLGAEPGSCVAIEDSLAGTASAQAAGVATLAVEHLIPIPPAPGRTVVNTLAGWTVPALAALL